MTEEQLPTGTKWEIILAQSQVDVEVIQVRIEDLKLQLARAEELKLELIQVKDNLAKV